MLSKNKIDAWIEEMLHFLLSIQNKNGSFDTMYLQPFYNPDEGWMKYAGNSPYETAFPLTVLSNTQTQRAEKIIHNGIRYIRNESLDNFLWTYAYPSKKSLVPYDTDSTSLCSFVLEKHKIQLHNKKFLNSLINNKGYYPFYIWPTYKNKNIPLLTYLKLKYWNWKCKNSTNIINHILELDDSEFSSTCINLLYLKYTKENKDTWDVIQQKFNDDEIDFIYYIDKYHALYHLTRLFYYNKKFKLNNDKLNHELESLKVRLNTISPSPKSILFLNTLLFSGKNLDEYSILIQEVIKEIEQGKYKENTAFYSSNVKTDIQPGTNLPNTYFGSPAITCSLYLEFLNLYRKRYYGE